MSNITQTYRHGDVNLVPEAIPAEAVTEYEGRRFVAQEGETTGHKHLVATKERPFAVRTYQGERYYDFPEGATITHEEHRTLSIPPGTYKQRQEREKDWFSLSVRQVID